MAAARRSAGPFRQSLTMLPDVRSGINGLEAARDGSDFETRAGAALTWWT